MQAGAQSALNHREEDHWKKSFRKSKENEKFETIRRFRLLLVQTFFSFQFRIDRLPSRSPSYSCHDDIVTGNAIKNEIL